MSGFRFAVRAFGLALTLALLSSCATTLPSGTDPSQPGPAQVTELSEVAFFPDNTTLCGPSSLAAVLRYAGVPTDPERLTPAVYLPGREGALQIEMLSAARRAGAVSYLLPANQEALIRSLNAGYPVVVLLNLGLSFAPSWHYAVLVGFESGQAGKSFILRSGEQRRQIMPAYTFEKTWSRSGRWAMVVSSPNRLPDFLPKQELIDALVKFERSAPGDLAVTAYSSALAGGIESAVLEMGLANAQEKQGRTEEAIAIWRRLMDQKNNLAAGVNLSFALQQQGKTAEAVTTACRLLQNSQQFTATPGLIDLSKEKLTQLLSVTGGQCAPPVKQSPAL